MRPSTSDMPLVALERLIAKRRHEIDRLLRKRRKLESRLQTVNDQITALGGAASRAGGPGSRPRNGVSLIEAIASVLEKAGGPLGIAAITQKVLATGYRSTSENFRGIVNQTLLKEKRFKNAGRGVYQLGRA